MAREHEAEGTISSLAARIVGTLIPRDAPLMEAGVDSLAASEFVKSIGSEFGVDLPATLLFDHPSVGSVCSHLEGEVCI